MTSSFITDPQKVASAALLAVLLPLTTQASEDHGRDCGDGGHAQETLLGAAPGSRTRAADQAVSAPSASRVLGPNAGKPVVGVYYYPWYRSASNAPENGTLATGWMRKTLRGRLAPQQLPSRGVYSSQDPETIADHIAQSRRGGVDFWAVSWWGPNHHTDATFKNHILPHAHAGTLKYAILYESTGRLGSFDEPSYTRLLDDFRYMAENYFDNPQYLKIEGRPVVFIYLTRVYFRNRGLEALRSLRDQFPDAYLVGDDVFGPSYRPEYARLWDAVTAYDVYGQSLQIAGATRAAVDRLGANYANARTIANSVETGFIPAISPGYNDKAVRAGHPGRARYFEDVPGSQEGDLFRAMVRDVALPNVDPLAGNVIMVTSFNEWYEDTQIEATAGTSPPTAKDDSASGKFYTEGDIYRDYGYLYLDLLRKEAETPSPPRRNLEKVGGVAVANILQRLGAKQEQGSTVKELDDYSSHFDRTDPNRDGKHTRKEYVDNGVYMTPQARAGIFRAADGNADGVVTRAEYVLNRIITDEAKTIVQGMDDDSDGLAERAEFVKHAAKLLADAEFAEQVYDAFDANADGGITIPEYLRVWGQWARLGQKSAEERIRARRAELADSANKPGKKPTPPGPRRPGSGTPSGRPGPGGRPPSVDEVFRRFDGNKDGKLVKDEIPEFVQQFILPADADGDAAVTKEELRASRQRRRPGGKDRKE